MSTWNERSIVKFLVGGGPTAIGLVALLAAVLAVLSPGEPTEIVVWDGVLKAALAALTVAAASKAPRWSVVFFASLAAAFGGLTIWGVLAWLALGAAVAAAFLKRRNRLVGALAAAIALQALLRIPAQGFFGFPSLVATVACAAVLVSGYRYSTGRVRRRVRRSASAALAITSIVILVGSLSLLNARSNIDTGVAAARRGLAAARSGDMSGVAAELSRAETALDSANTKASGSGARLLRLLPVAAQHQRTIEAATAAGALVARDAADVVLTADIEAISLTAGSVDLAALQAMAPQLRQTADSLESAAASLDAADSSWILSPLRNRIADLTEEIDALRPEVALAADAAETVPAMLGLGTPDTYFVILGTPAESREFGGFIGSWALLTFDDGFVQLGDSGRISELYAVAAESTVLPGTVSDWFLGMARPTRFPQNLTSSPDFAQVAAVSNQVIGAASERPLSGFIYLDAWALVDLLEVTGPVDISFQDEPLTADNSEKFFFRDQYDLDGTRTEVFDTLAVVASTVLDRMSEQTLPGPEELGRILGPAARAGHLQMVTFDDDQNNFLRSVKLLRDFGRDETQDFVGVVQANGLSNKMDLYLHRTLDYVAAVDADGSFRGTAKVTLRSDVPDDAPESTLGRGDDRGNNNVLLSLYSRHGVTGVTVNGEAVDFNVTSEFGMGRYLVAVTVPSNAAAFVVEYSLEGFLPPAEPYSLEVWHQPLINTDDVTVSIGLPDGRIDWSGPLVENQILEIE